MSGAAITQWPGLSTVCPKLKDYHTSTGAGKLFALRETRSKNDIAQITSIEGSDAILPCSTSGQDKPEVTWYFNHRPLDRDQRHQITSAGLSINSVKWKDRGTYGCFGGQKLGMGRKLGFGREKNRIKPISIYRLEILASPKFLQPPSIPEKIILGHKLTLSCEGQGSPYIRYEWLKEQKTSSKIRMKSKLSENKKQYSIEKTSIEDEGRYYCRLSNQYGSNESFVDVKFLIPASVFELGPSVTTIREGGQLNVTCRSRGFPLPKILWMVSIANGVIYEGADALRDQGYTITDATDAAMSTTERVSTLKARNVKRSQAGNITCLAYNEVDKASKTAIVYIEYKPKVEISPNATYAWVGQIKILKCRGVAYPRPTITWFRGLSTPIKNEDDGIFKYESESESFNTENSYLTISIKDDLKWIYGNYTCLAKNHVAHSSAYTSIVRAQLPDQPRNITIIEETSTSVTFSASPAGVENSMQITNWSVSYNEQKPGSRQYFQSFQTGDSMVITDLKPSTQYIVHLSVGNIVGFSTPLQFRVHTTKEKSNESSLKIQTMSPHKQDGVRMDASDAYDLSYAEKNSYKIDQKTDYESKYLNIRKSKKKSNDEIPNGQYTPLVIGIGLTLTIFAGGALACFFYVWRNKRLKRQPTSEEEFVSNRVQVASPIPPNSILLVPVTNIDGNGKPLLTEHDVESVTTELINTMQQQQHQQQPQQPLANKSFNRANSIDSFSPYGTFPRRLNFFESATNTPTNSTPAGPLRAKLNLRKLEMISPSSPPKQVFNVGNNSTVRMFEAFRPVSVDPIREHGSTNRNLLLNACHSFNSNNSDANEDLANQTLNSAFSYPNNNTTSSNQTSYGANKFCTLTAVRPVFEAKQLRKQDHETGVVKYPNSCYTTPKRRPTVSNGSVSKKDHPEGCNNNNNNNDKICKDQIFKVDYDGYQSGDNVDDDIDSVRYLPALAGQRHPNNCEKFNRNFPQNNNNNFNNNSNNNNFNNNNSNHNNNNNRNYFQMNNFHDLGINNLSNNNNDNFPMSSENTNLSNQLFYESCTQDDSININNNTNITQGGSKSNLVPEKRTLVSYTVPLNRCR
ncbi:hypothetical protein HELRODRAFT_178415 [Helobdella robusta]|uniref:Uncharacterized protein n=1 Tax=Helobdella robusta TaxID=6412 RepID=T1FD50_HELRO|nr:hypothetical protein HELRODRAFT_178415 [Helobdella robusta]ESN97287.1 hypothetical protein HELRODRAFT_178415 [Helobdella robusta]